MVDGAGRVSDGEATDKKTTRLLGRSQKVLSLLRDGFLYRACAADGHPLPNSTDPTATVTFMDFRGQTYAVTAGHVVSDFRATVDDPEKWTFFIPKAPGHTLFDRFVLPPAGLIGGRPDIAIRKIDPGLPAHLGKDAFLLSEETQPDEFPYALAVGFPTVRKEKREAGQVAMECCHAVAEGVTTGYGDQVQFYSEIADWPEIASLSGMSGGPVFWNDGTARGLIGIVKNAMSNEQQKDNIGGGPRVHFICQRFSAREFAGWTSEL